MEEDPDLGGGDLLDGRHHLSAAGNCGAQEEVRGLHLPRRGSFGQYFFSCNPKLFLKYGPIPASFQVYSLLSFLQR